MNQKIVKKYTDIKNNDSKDDIIGKKEIQDQNITNENIINNLDNEKNNENKNDNEFDNDNTNDNKNVIKKDNKNDDK